MEFRSLGGNLTSIPIDDGDLEVPFRFPGIDFDF